MRIFALKPSAKILPGALLVLALLGGSACQQTASNTTTTTTSDNAANTSTANSSNSSNANMGETGASGTAINASEPSQYSATISIRLETTGNQSMPLPTLSANFARNGESRRISFKAPGGDEVVYLDRPDKHYVILPGRKQYAEIDEKSTGFDVKTLMSPAQLVNQIKNVKGCTNAGDEAFGGRPATKYTCGGSAKTGTQAGEMKAESIIYVDKETSLPLHSESIITASGNVNGANGAKIVTELSNIQTTVVPTTFDDPTGMSKVDPAQVRGQLETILKAAAIFMQNMMQSSSTTMPPPPPPSAPTPTK